MLSRKIYLEEEFHNPDENYTSTRQEESFVQEAEILILR